MKIKITLLTSLEHEMSESEVVSKRKPDSPQDSCKRQCLLPSEDSVDNASEPTQKSNEQSHDLEKLSNCDEKFPSKKRYAILMGYCGENYKGMMINPGVKTVEEELLKGLERAKLIKPYNAKDIKKLSFQRASRTDKGVSAARQIVSCNLHVSNLQNDIKTLNNSLPDDIIIYNIIRTTKSYDCHKYASSRVYEYLCPTYAFAGTFADTWVGYRITPDVLVKVRETLQYFVGTKNFFNYTSGKKVNDPSCSRYIRSIECSEEFLIDDTEWVKIKLHGDSFMYHMIRKIIGMTIAIIRNVTPSDYLSKSFENDRCDVPLAPGLGLILYEVKQLRYNTKFGSDGQHESLGWEKYEEMVNKFKMEKIEKVIYNIEMKTRTVLQWLDTLQKHKFFTGHVLPDILFATSG